MAAEAAEDVAAAAAEDPHEAQQEKDRKETLSFEVARCNMASELGSALVVLAVVVAAFAQGRSTDRTFSPQVVLICCGVQALSVGAAMLLNARSLTWCSVALAPWEKSRLVLVCLGAFLSGVVGITFYVTVYWDVAARMPDCGR